MDRLICNYYEGLDKPCKRPMYFIGIHSDPSSGLQTTEYGCFSLNSKHTIDMVEPIPDWNEFRKERKEKINYQGHKLSDKRLLEISSMLAKSIPQLQIAKELRCSCTTIRNIRAITLLAAVGMVIKNIKKGK